MEKAFRGWRRFVSVKHRVRNLTFNPMHRDLNRGDYRLLWNALLKTGGQSCKRRVKARFRGYKARLRFAHWLHKDLPPTRNNPPGLTATKEAQDESE